MNEPLAAFFRYNAWANEALIEACRPLAEEQLDARGEATYGTIRELLMHYLGSQEVYLSDLRGGVRDKDHWRRHPWPGLDAIAAFSMASSAALLVVAANLEADEEVTFMMELDDPKRALKSLLLVQALQHATEHREQICATLTRIGVPPPDLSGWAFRDATQRQGDLEA